MTRPASPLALLTLVLLVSTMSGCGGHDFLDDSAAFDRAYIPALVHTGQGRAAEAREAMARLTRRWDDYYGTYRDYRSEPEWAAAFDMAARHVSRADSLLSREAPLQAVHEALEPVRLALADVRRAFGMDYYLDRLTNFHTSMEHVYGAVEGETPETLGAEDVARIMNFYPELQAEWQRVSEAAPDADRFALGGRKAALLDDFVEREGETVEALGRALERSDEAAVIEQGRALRAGFVRLFMLFGDFDDADVEGR